MAARAAKTAYSAVENAASKSLVENGVYCAALGLSIDATVCLKEARA